MYTGRFGLVTVTRKAENNVISYTYALPEGDIVAISLDLLLSNPSDIYWLNEQLHIGPYIFNIIDFNPPQILICKLAQ